MLTAKQKDLLLLLHRWTLSHGTAPSFEEMAIHIGLKSKSGVHRLISALEERGYILRLPNRARAIEVVRLPQDCLPEESEKLRSPFKDTALIPFADIQGRTTGQNFTVPSSFLSGVQQDACFALIWQQDPLHSVGIMTGDILILERCETAPQGALVLVRYGNNKALPSVIEYNHSDSKSPSLYGTGGAMVAPKIISKTLEGRVIGLLRSYK